MNYRNIYSRYSKKHPYHIVQVSPWPFFIGVGVFCLTSGFVFYVHEYVYAFIVLLLGLFILSTIICYWCRNVVREATFEGNYIFEVRKRFRIGMIILSSYFLYRMFRIFFKFFFNFNS